MESVETRRPTIPMVLGIIGGALLGAGSLLDWATWSLDWNRFAAAIGQAPAQIPASIRAQGTGSITGPHTGQGTWMLIAGVAVVIASALLVFAKSTQAVALVMIFGGAVGGSMAVYEATAGKNRMIDQAVANLFGGVELPGDLRSFISVSIGIGLRLCALGGLFAIVAGSLAMSRRGQTVSATPDSVPGTS